MDRVEISIIEEAQPRWLSFLNGQHDYIDRLPPEFIDVAMPGGRVAPHLAKQGVRGVITLVSDVTFTYFNMDDPVVGGLAAAAGGAAPRHQPGHRRRSARSASCAAAWPFPRKAR